MKKVLLGIAIVLLLLVIGGISLVGWQVVLGPKARAVTARTFEKTEARRARGEYLVENVVSCFHCHSEPDLADPRGRIKAGMKGAGWEFPTPELGKVIAPNITPDVETGIGGWTDDEVARAIQEGVSKDGHALFPIMPYMSFRNMDDEDLASIVVYLRTVPAVKLARPRTELIFPLSVLVKTMPTPLASHDPQPAPVRASAEARGEYIVRTLSGCGDCHSPTGDQNQPLPGKEFSGGSEFPNLWDNGKTLHSLNITPDASGIAHYDQALFIQTFRSGAIAGRPINPIMPIEHYRGMTDGDLGDVFAFLQSLPKVQHRVSNTDAPTLCPVCGKVHGLGELNQAAVK
jgi:mono/diheme cytochrome c family protein